MTMSKLRYGKYYKPLINKFVVYYGSILAEKEIEFDEESLADKFLEKLSLELPGSISAEEMSELDEFAKRLKIIKKYERVCKLVEYKENFTIKNGYAQGFFNRKNLSRIPMYRIHEIANGVYFSKPDWLYLFSKRTRNEI